MTAASRKLALRGCLKNACLSSSDVELCKCMTSTDCTHSCTQGAGCRLDESESSASYTSEERRGR